MDDLQSGIAVVIDVLRASTTIVHALAAGAQAVVPFIDVEQVRREAKGHPAGTVVTGGERSGKRITGFDLGNSPLEYWQEIVRDKTVLFTTTNGTRALDHCRQAERVFVGAFVNLAAITRTLADADCPVHLVCAGTDGHITTEDVLCAGAIVRRLQNASQTASCLELNDEACMASDLFALHGQGSTRLIAALRASRGGRNLISLGYDDDITRAADIDLFDVVPEYDPHTQLITPVRRAG